MNSKQKKVTMWFAIPTLIISWSAVLFLNHINAFRGDVDFYLSFLMFPLIAAVFLLAPWLVEMLSLEDKE